MLELPRYKKWLSNIIPVTYEIFQGEEHKKLKVKYYKRRWLLESGGALYSEGNTYKPFLLAYESIGKKALIELNSFLLLGAGLGSGLLILHEKFNHFPKSDLVDYDYKILEQIVNLPSIHSFDGVNLVHQKADIFLDQSQKTYDLIGVDLFHEMILDPYVFTNKFLIRLNDALNEKGIVIVNSIFNKAKEATHFETQLSKNFQVRRIEYQPNYIFICTKLILEKA